MGAILGAPFMLSTLAMFVTGIAVIVVARRDSAHLQMAPEGTMTAGTRHRIVTDDLAQITAAPLPWAKLDGKTVVVTGAAGLIASYLVEALLYRNETGTGAPMRVVATAQLPEVLRSVKESGKSFGLLAHTKQPGLVPLHALRQLPDEPEGYARGLYAALRELDQAGNDLIVVEDIPGEPGWAAVADRLRRAACGSGVF